MKYKQLHFFLNMSLVQSKIAKSFDTSLGNGIGFNDFIILYSLYTVPDKKMRRIDLAHKISLSPSGVTRMLIPMEKIGLVGRESSNTDARVSYVTLAPGGERLLTEALERAEYLSESLLPSTGISNLSDLSEIFSLFSIDASIYYSD